MPQRKPKLACLAPTPSLAVEVVESRPPSLAIEVVVVHPSSLHINSCGLQLLRCFSVPVLVKL